MVQRSHHQPTAAATNARLNVGKFGGFQETEMTLIAHNSPSRPTAAGRLMLESFLHLSTNICLLQRLDELFRLFPRD